METSTLESNKEIARKTFEAIQNKDYALLESITDTAKFKLHFPGFDKPLNFEESKQINSDYDTAFPDVKINIEYQVAEGDLVMSRVVFNATNTGDFQGIPASGKKIKASGMTIQRIVENKIVEEWDEMDALGMMQQIGAIPNQK